MKKYLFTLILIIIPLSLYARKAYIGVEINALGMDGKNYTGKETVSIVKGLGGRMRADTEGAFILGLYQGVEINEYISLLAKERYFSVGGIAKFYTQPAMDFEISKNIVPLNLGIRLRMEIDEIFSFYLEGLPGVYLIDSFENGYFGNYHKRDITFGTNLSMGGDFLIKEKINITIGIIYELFNLLQYNIILDDGGDGGGIGINLRIGTVF